MGKKLKHAGVLAVDPSWKGLALACYLPVHNYEFACCLDIRGGLKRFDLPQNTITLVCRALHELFEQEPLLRCCTLIVMENQFKTKMRNLEWIVTAALKMMMHDHECKVEYVSILKLKKHFSLECTGSHYQNKKGAVKYVSEHERELLIGPLHDLNDNRCDAILLLNYSAQQNKLEFMSYGLCKTCDNELVLKESQSAANPGRPFVTCPNGRGKTDDQPANKCNNSFNWWDPVTGKPVPKESKWGSSAGQKRAPIRSTSSDVKSEPPVKKVAVTDQRDLMMLEEQVRKLRECMAEQIDALKIIMDTQMEAFAERLDAVESKTFISADYHDQ